MPEQDWLANKLPPFHVHQANQPIYWSPSQITRTHFQSDFAVLSTRQLYFSSIIPLAMRWCWASWCTVVGYLWPSFLAWDSDTFSLAMLRWKSTWKAFMLAHPKWFAHKLALKWTVCEMCFFVILMRCFNQFSVRFFLVASKTPSPERCVSYQQQGTVSPTAPSCHDNQIVCEAQISHEKVETLPPKTEGAEEDCCCRL